MMRLLADENFNNDILRGLLRQLPTLDIVRVQDTILYKAPDPAVLAWAAQENRVLLTHDVQTMNHHAYQRIETGQKMPGVIQVDADLAIGKAIEDLLLVIGASKPDEWENCIIHIPLN